MTTNIKLGKLNFTEIYFVPNLDKSIDKSNIQILNLDIGKDASDRIQKYFVRNKKRIYTNKCYHIENGLVLDVHKNGLFYYSECYELTENGSETQNVFNLNLVINRYNKKIQPSDNFPILRDYILETEKNVLEFLVGEHLVLLCEKDKKHWLKIHTYNESNLDNLIKILTDLIKNKKEKRFN